MKKFLLANYKWIFAILLATNFVAVSATSAQSLDLWGDSVTQTTKIGESEFTAIGLGNRDPRKIAASVIRVILGFLGVIAVCLILFGGFKWMTAAGDDGKVDEAKDLIKAGVVGLLIILAAFSISVFVLNALIGVTTGNSDSIIQQN
ncbi:MAG TPA: hypothetical protein PLJ58_02035 [bacterium]|nr:hypothetical protein [bacterium]